MDINWNKIKKIVELRRKNEQLVLECEMSEEILLDLLNEEFNEDKITLENPEKYPGLNKKEHIAIWIRSTHLKDKYETLEKICDYTGWTLLKGRGSIYIFNQNQRFPVDIILKSGKKRAEMKEEIEKYIEG